MFELTEKLTVTALVRSIQDTLSCSFGLVTLKGEVAQFTRASSGHWYMTLKDAHAQVKAVMFSRQSVHVGFFPKVGDSVEVTAEVSVYPARGDLQIICQTLKKAGQGDLHEQFLRLKSALKKEGIFDAERKQMLPRYVFSVGVVTSAQSAAWADIQTAFARRSPHIRFQLYPSAVQGAAATNELIQAIGRADRSNHDVLLIGRGGGSLEDLWCFNEERVVRAVAACQTPTVVGVGHESDVTLAEFAADVRAATPTAGAELCSIPTVDILDSLATCWDRIGRTMQRQLDRMAQRLDRLDLSLVTPQDRINLAEQFLTSQERWMQQRLRDCVQRAEQELTRLERTSKSQSERCVNASSKFVTQLQARLQHLAQRGAHRQAQRVEQVSRLLTAVSPQRNLEKGYVFLQQGEGDSSRIIKRVGQVQVGQMLRATLSDGEIHVQVSEKSSADH